MEEHTGLRERKKRRTRQAISDAAIRLILDRGFDRVSVADIAAAAEVSKPTLFTYFRTKEDLILDRISDHREESARVVRGRAPGEAPLAALHRHFRELLADRDPISGLNDDPASLRLREIVYGTRSLAAGLLRYAQRSEQALAEALHETDPPGSDPLTARLAAAAIVTLQGRLAADTWARLSAGRTAADLYPDAVAAADHAYGLLSGGLAGHYGGPGSPQV